MALDIEGKIYRVGKTQHVKPGKGGAYVQVRSRDVDGSGIGNAGLVLTWRLVVSGGAEGDQDRQQDQPPLPRRGDRSQGPAWT